MKYVKSVVTLILLMSLAGGGYAWNGSGNHGGGAPVGGTSHMSGGSGFRASNRSHVDSHVGAGRVGQPRGAPGIGGERRFRGGDRIANRQHRGNGRATTVIIGAPLLWPWSDPVPYSYPQAYIENGNPVWYYCEDPPGYYPAVTECPGGWQPVVPDTSPQY